MHTKTIFKSRNRLDIRAHTKQLRRGPTTHLFKMPRARTAPIVGSWCRAAAKFISSCKELSSPLYCLGVCIRVPRIPITGNDAKRAAAWMGRQITEIMGNERLDAHYCGAASTSWTFMNHARPLPSCSIFNSAKQTGSKNGVKTLVHNSSGSQLQPPLWHCEDGHVSRPWIQSQLLPRSDKAFRSTQAAFQHLHNCPGLLSSLII